MKDCKPEKSSVTLTHCKMLTTRCCWENLLDKTDDFALSDRTFKNND